MLAGPFRLLCEQGSCRESGSRSGQQPQRRKRSLHSPRPNNNLVSTLRDAGRLLAQSNTRQSPRTRLQTSSIAKCLNILPTRDHIMATASIKASRLPNRPLNRHTDISILLQTIPSLLPSQVLLHTTPCQCTNPRASLDLVWIPIAICPRARLTTTQCKFRVWGLVAHLPRARLLASRLFPVLGVNHRLLSRTISHRP